MFIITFEIRCDVRIATGAITRCRVLSACRGHCVLDSAALLRWRVGAHRGVREHAGVCRLLRGMRLSADCALPRSQARMRFATLRLPRRALSRGAGFMSLFACRDHCAVDRAIVIARGGAQVPFIVAVLNRAGRWPSAMLLRQCIEAGSADVARVTVHMARW